MLGRAPVGKSVRNGHYSVGGGLGEVSGGCECSQVKVAAGRSEEGNLHCIPGAVFVYQQHHHSGARCRSDSSPNGEICA